MSLSLKQDVKAYLYENYNGHFLSFGITVDATKAVLKNIIEKQIKDLEDQMIGSRPSDNEKIYTVKDVMARTINELEKLKEVFESKF